MKDHIKFGSISVEIPQDCPNRAAFEDIIQRVIVEHFGTAERAARCRDAWQLTQIVPEPFVSNIRAAELYSRALFELDARAQAWGAFEDDIHREFADREDDGDAKEPAISDWSPGRIVFT